MKSFRQFILEGRSERYYTYLNGLDIADDVKYNYKRYIDGIVSKLKRDDVIQWYLRIWKYREIRRSDNKSDTMQKWADDFIAKVNAKSSFDDITQLPHIDTLEHFLSLPIPEIQNTRFLYQHPGDIEDKFRKLEREWIKKNGSSKEWIDITDELKNGDIEELINCGGGYFWFNLNRRYCELEGKAMGHCGNKASDNDDETVLSMRLVKRQKGRTLSRPSLTFIYNNRGQSLGEMKGRANNKPEAKYHSQILKLLMHEVGGKYFVKKIRGGGYKPEANFALFDLSKSELDSLFENRPELETLGTAYKRNGEKYSEEMLSRFVRQYKKGDIQFENTEGRVYIYQGMNTDEFLKELDMNSGDITQRLLDAYNVDDLTDLGYNARVTYFRLIDQDRQDLDIDKKYPEMTEIQVGNGFLKSWKNRFKDNLFKLLENELGVETVGSDKEYYIFVEDDKVWVVIQDETFNRLVESNQHVNIHLLIDYPDVNEVIKRNYLYYTAGDMLHFSEKDALNT